MSAVADRPEGQAMKQEVLQRSVLIRNPQGFHLRPAAALAQAARQFQSEASVVHGDVRANARDAMELLMLLAEPGAQVLIEVSGPDAAEAMEALAEILGAEQSMPPPKKG